MFTVKLTIEGDFWDCQIYMGRLYLWTMDGTLKVFKWDELVNSLEAQNSDNKLVMNCAFTSGNYLYGDDLKSIFGDREFKNLLTHKFKRISDKTILIDHKKLQKFLYGEQQNPFKELPTDTEISSKTLYGVTDSGIWAGSAHRYNERYPVSSKPSKIWDCPILSLKANRYSQLALSAGEEGLFEFNTNADRLSTAGLKKIEESIFQISKHHSQASDWSYLSIYSTSSVSESYMAFYEWENEALTIGRPNPNQFNIMSSKRKFSSEINEKEIFGRSNKGLSWGSGDKLYKAYDGTFSMTRFRNTLREKYGDEEHFYDKHEIKLDAWKGEVLGGSTAYFGTVVECENALVVVQSNKETFTIPGPVTKWRIYPRSINYENHLHVILDDKIEIYSFNNDYFVEQEKKEFGLRYSHDKRFSRRR